MYKGCLDDVLFALANRVAVGGFVVMDDYLCVAEAKAAVDESRTAHGILQDDQAMHQSGQCCGWWRVTRRLAKLNSTMYEAFNAQRAPFATPRLRFFLDGLRLNRALGFQRPP